MPLSSADLATVRSLIGPATPPTDSDLNNLWDVLGDVNAIALQVLSGRLAAAMSQPEEYQLEGDLKVKWGASIETLKTEVLRLRGLVGSDAAVPWVGGTRWSELTDPDPDLVGPYFRESPWPNPWPAPRGRWAEGR